MSDELIDSLLRGEVNRLTYVIDQQQATIRRLERAVGEQTEMAKRWKNRANSLRRRLEAARKAETQRERNVALNGNDATIQDYWEDHAGIEH